MLKAKLFLVYFDVYTNMKWDYSIVCTNAMMGPDLVSLSFSKIEASLLWKFEILVMAKAQCP